MTKKRRIYQISIALLLCLMQTAGIAMYGQSRPRAAAKRIHRLQADSLHTLRKAVQMQADSLTPATDKPMPHQAVTPADSITTADSIAAKTGTINYEIICGISRRVPRVYLRDGAPVRIWNDLEET